MSNPSSLDAFSLSLAETSTSTDDNAIVVEGFSISAPAQQLFVNADLKIVKGHRYGILGPNGQGKTTLLKHLAARALPVPASWDVLLVEQEAKVSDKSIVMEVMSADFEGCKLIEEEAHLLKILQSDDDLPIEELEEAQNRLQYVLTELRIRGTDRQEARVRKILNGLGFIGPAQERTVQEFSGGWRMRVNLAKALFIQPKLLMLDEPTNHLDLDAVLWLDKYLSEEYPHTVLVVSHDADFLDSICTDILLVHDKKISAYRGGYTEFVKMREQQKLKAERDWDTFQKALNSAKSKQEKEAMRKKYEAVTKPTEYQVKFQLKGQGVERRLGGIGLSDVCFSYTGHEPWVIKDVDFGMDCASRVALVGPNGAGKSTFLKLLVGELQPCLGNVMTNPGLRVEMFSQHFEEGLDLTVSPIEYLVKTASDFKLEELKTHEKARQILGRYGLPSESHTKLIGKLSGGQKARVAFAALGLRAPHILVLDEPTNHLDIETVDALIEALDKYDGGVLIVSHDARLINQVGCTLWVCRNRSCFEFQGDFDGYRDVVLGEIAEREAEAEAIAHMDRDKKRQLYQEKLGKERFESVLNQGEIKEAAPIVTAAAVTIDTSNLVFGKSSKKKKAIVLA